jgi:hypothetical protein
VSGNFGKNEIPQLIGERGHLATTACMAQDIFSKIIIPRYSQVRLPDFCGKFAVFEKLFPPVDNSIGKNLADAAAISGPAQN